MESILTTIKKLLGLGDDYAAFDTDVIANINTALMSLTQLGVGPTDGYFISGESETWSDFIGGSKSIEAVKTYIYLSVKLVFDPPTSNYVLESMDRQIYELAWRIRLQAES